tara:strand:- start:57 stop:1229 length:1173 start_codon:yes stop_codon:yes gene_type:complete
MPRISKPEFNLRDKISHLDIPVGAHGGQLIKSSSPDETFDLLGLSSGKRNVIVNGAMRLNQRNAASYDAANYTLDRWRYHRSSDGEFDIKQSTVAPPGFQNSLHVDCKVASQTTSVGSYSRIRYFVEGADCRRFGKGTSNPRNFCLSFYVKSNVLGNYSVNLQDSNSRVITRNYKVTDTDWHRYVIVFPNENVSPITSNVGTGIEIQFGLTHGTNYTGGEGRDGWSAHAANKEHTGSDVRLWTSTDNNWYLTGVQLEVGDVATPFEHLSLQEDLARCQRYYWSIIQDGTHGAFIGTSAGYGSGNYNLVVVPHPVKMRMPVSSIETSGTASDYQLWGGNTVVNLTSVPALRATSNQYGTSLDLEYSTSANDARMFRIAGSSSAKLGFSAEM